MFHGLIGCIVYQCILVYTSAYTTFFFVYNTLLSHSTVDCGTAVAFWELHLNVWMFEWLVYLCYVCIILLNGKCLFIWSNNAERNKPSVLQSVVLVTSAWSGRLGQDSSVHWAQCSLGAEVSDHSYLCSNRFSCFPTLQCLHVCPYYGSSWQSVPRHTTVPSHDNVSTQPLATSLPRHLPSVKGSCAYGRLWNCFQMARFSSVLFLQNTFTF